MPESPAPATRTDTHAKPQAAGAPVNVRPVGPVVGFCFVVAGSVTAYVGYQLGQFYGGGQDPPPGRVGAMWGLLAGLVVATLWCAMLYRATRRLAHRAKTLLVLGAGLGALLTACSASLLTLREMLAFGWERIGAPGAHLFSSLAAGAGLGAVWGLVCGATWTRAVRLQRRASGARDQTTSVPDAPGSVYRAADSLAYGLCLLAGLLLGLLASMGYEPSVATVVVGCVVGALVGVAVADLWIRAMRALSPALEGKGMLTVLLGTSLGVAAGVLATGVLHGALMLVASGTSGGIPFWFGLMYFGIPVGAAIGAICSMSWACHAVWPSNRRPDRRAGGAGQ